MHPQDHAKEVWRVQASDNIDTHETLCAIDELVTESVRQASINWRQDNHLVSFAEYNNL